MSKRAPTVLGPELREIASHLAAIVGGIDAEVLFVTCLDEDGVPSESECFASHERAKTELPLDHLFSLPKKIGASAVLVASKSSGSLDPVGEEDVEFTRRLIEAGARNGVRVAEHILVRDGEFSALSASTGLFPENPRKAGRSNG